MRSVVLSVAVLSGLSFVGGCAGPTGIEHLMDAAQPPEGDMAVPSHDLAMSPDLAKSGDMAMAVGKTCNPANKTLGAAGGPDVCAYGEDCDDVTMKCTAVAEGSCNMVMGAPTWDKASKMAPVITKATATYLATTDSTTECTNGDPAALVTVEYYSPSTFTTAATASAFLPQTKFKKSVVATDPFYNGTFLRTPVPTGTFGTFQVGINCGGAGGSVKTAGFYILDDGGHASNAVCVSW